MIFIIIAVILGFAVGLLSNPKIQEMREPSRSTLLVFLGFPGKFLFQIRLSGKKNLVQEFKQ